jgi:hypothetical protein
MTSEIQPAALDFDDANDQRKGVDGVYLLRTTRYDFWKVGLTQNLRQRFLTLYRSCPLQLELVLFVAEPDPQALESQWHGAWRQWSVGNEWFEIPVRDLRRARQLMGWSIGRRRRVSVVDGGWK